MRMLPLRIAGLILAAIAPAAAGAAHRSAAERGAAELARQLRGFAPQGTQRCLTTSDYENIYIVDSTALVFRGLGGRLWVNRTTGPDHLRDDDIPEQDVFGGQVCRLDQVRLLDRTTRAEHFVVLLGDFTAYRKVGSR